MGVGPDRATSGGEFQEECGSSKVRPSVTLQRHRQTFWLRRQASEARLRRRACEALTLFRNRAVPAPVQTDLPLRWASIR